MADPKLIRRVKLVNVDIGFCREYYKGVDNGRFYARQEEGENNFIWYTTDCADGEPECEVRKDLVFEIVK